MTQENHKEIKTLMDFPVDYINFSYSKEPWYIFQENITKTINRLIKKCLK
jgi:hypothetical protein